ncbi:MAG: hypothetical protein P4L03_08125 [Terracidiphilus sp.]|nr:hypothetical protein [Terracidiphilus sp.]
MRLGSLLMAVLACAGTAAAQEYLNCNFASGWQTQGQKRAYTSVNLFEYKDGGAEGYLQYGFAKMQGSTCVKDGNTIDIDVSEMSDSDAAYGMLMANVDQSLPMEKIGIGGQVQKQSAIAAKGKFYVEIVETAVKANADDSAFLRERTTKILGLLEGGSEPPRTIAWFVPDDLVQVRMVPESVLGLKQIKRGYAAKYKQGQAFIAEQSTVEEATALVKALEEKFKGTAASVGEEGFTAKAKYLDGICVFRKGRVVAGAANLPDPDAALAQAKKLAARIP